MRVGRLVWVLCGTVLCGTVQGHALRMAAYCGAELTCPAKSPWRRTTTIASTSADIDSLAARAADAMSHGRAHVEPMFLSAHALDDARADLMKVLSQVIQGDSESFESIETDLLDPGFRQQLGSSLPFPSLLGQLDELRAALAKRTGRALLEGGGLHLMHYPVGSKFMRHVDEDPSMYEPRRNSISFLIYLTSSQWDAADGGALRIFEAAEGDTPREVLPLGGTLVIYDSTIEHEVLVTLRERHLISGRFRESDEDWQRRRKV